MKKQVMEAGAHVFLEKPVSIYDLRKKVEMLLTIEEA